MSARILVVDDGSLTDTLTVVRNLHALASLVGQLGPVAVAGGGLACNSH